MLGIDPAANVARRRRSAACRRSSSSSASSSPSGSSARAGRADLVLGNNVLAQVPGPQRLRRAASRSCSRPAARRRSSSRTSRGCSRASSTTRSTTSTSRTSRSTTIREIFAAHGLDGRRRRGAPEPRRLAARLRAARGGGRSALEPAVAELVAREEAEGLRDPERYARFAERGRRSRSARCSSC